MIELFILTGIALVCALIVRAIYAWGRRHGYHAATEDFNKVYNDRDGETENPWQGRGE